MATTLTAQLKLLLTHVFTTTVNLSVPVDNFRLDLSDALANGALIDMAEQVFYDQRTLVATSENLDLSGVLTNPFVQTVAFTKIKALIIKNTSVAVGADLIVGNSGGNCWFAPFDAATDEVTIGPGGILLLWNPSAAGYPVVAGASDLLKIDAGAATIIYDIYILGTIT